MKIKTSIWGNYHYLSEDMESKVMTQALQVMLMCIDECDRISQPLLDNVLIHLLSKVTFGKICYEN